MISRGAVFSLALTMAALGPYAWGLDSKQVFEAVAPSTVLIEDVDSFGSGVFLNDKGLILTNYHVVAANLSLKVRARIKFGSKVVLTELDDVKLTKVHKEYDLALLEVKPPPNGKFVAARIVPQTPPLAAGIKCFALGNPGGPTGKALELSITEGLVSAASRKMDGLDYIQISAQINPGNSGGPVCDEAAQVIGIATWKFTDTEGIGFAIPTQRLNMADFIDPKDRKSDTALYSKAEDYGRRMVEASQLAQGREREALLMAGLEAYRMSMLAAPNDAIPLCNICVVYQRLGRWNEAKKYAAAALRVAPNDPNACHMLGAMLAKEAPKDTVVAAQSLDMWLRGLANASGDLNSRSRCADDAAIMMLNEEKWTATAYMVQWADVLAVGMNRERFNGSMADFLRNWAEILAREANYDGRVSNRLKIWRLLHEKMPAAELALLRAKGEGFSKDEFEALVAGKPLASVVKPGVPAPPPAAGQPAGKPAPPASVATAAPSLISSVTQAQMDRIVKDAAAKFGPTQVSVPAEGMECPLPDVPGRTILAYAGWQAVIAFPELLKLGVFNLATGNLDGFIDCEDRDPMFAAGGQLLAVCSARTQTLELHDLSTMQKIGSRTMGADERIHFVGMGLLNPTSVFVLQLAKERGHGEFFQPSLLKVPDLTGTTLQPEKKNGNNPLWNVSAGLSHTLDGGMEETGAAAAVADTSDHSPTGVSYYGIQEGNRIEFKYHRESLGVPALAQGGRLVVAPEGLYDPTTDSDPTAHLYPSNAKPWMFAAVTGYPAFVDWGPSPAGLMTLRVTSLPAMAQLASRPMEAIGGITPTGANYKKVIGTMLASAHCDRIACVLPAEKKLVLLPLGLKSGAAGSGYAQAGQKFSRKLAIPAGSNVTIQSGPKDLKYDAPSGSLVWDVPADIKRGQMIQVILLVKDADGKQSYAVEKISVP